MNIKQIKEICKITVEYSKRPFTKTEKDILKQLINLSSNLEQLLLVSIASLSMGTDKHYS